MKKILLSVVTATLLLTSCIKEDLSNLSGKCGTVKGSDFDIHNGQYDYYLDVEFAIQTKRIKVSYEVWINADYGERICF